VSCFVVSWDEYSHTHLTGERKVSFVRDTRFSGIPEETRETGIRGWCRVSGDVEKPGNDEKI